MIARDLYGKQIKQSFYYVYDTVSVGKMLVKIEDVHPFMENPKSGVAVIKIKYIFKDELKSGYVHPDRQRYTILGTSNKLFVRCTDEIFDNFQLAKFRYELA